jgi:predicted nucleic acid-binding protein
MIRRFLDSNIFIYHITGNHPDYSPRCHTLMDEVEAGQIQAVTSVTAVDEVLRVLTRTFGNSRRDAADAMSTLINQPEFDIDYRQAVLDAITFWGGQGPLSFVDCYHLALTKELGLTQIYTFDKKMDRFPGVERIEPE